MSEGANPVHWAMSGQGLPAAAGDPGSPDGGAARYVRRRKSRKPALPQLTLAIAPMVDMSFLFLIFFVATSRFESPEGMLSSALPGVSDRSSASLPISPIVVRLASIGDGPCVVTIDRFDSPRDLASLAESLLQVQRQPGFDAETPVVLIADTGVRWEHVVEAWNAALRAGCRKIAFGEP